MLKYLFFAVISIILALTPQSLASEKLDYDYISSLLSEEKLDEAAAILTRHIAKDSKDESALSLLGDIYRRKREHGTALKYLNKALSINADYPPAHLYLGKLYFSMQRFDEAVNEFDIFRKIATDYGIMITDQDFYIGNLQDISLLYFSIKRYKEAAALLNEILIISPSNQVALYNFGIYYYQSERNRSMAYRYFTKAIEIDPKSSVAAKARYAIEFIRTNPDPRVTPDFSFIDQEYHD